MKPQLLEYLIRECAKEVLSQIREEEETVGPAAPPADGQGTADQPPVPKEEPKSEEKPKEPETPPAPDLKGIVFINPRDKSKLQKINVGKVDDANLERSLHSLASRSAGSKVKIALSTIRAVKAAAQNPNTPVYLYIGQYDPNSEELFLMADNSLQVAKDSSIDPTLMSSGVSAISPETQFNPLAAGASSFAAHLQNQGHRQPVGLSELRSAIKTIVSEILDAE